MAEPMTDLEAAIAAVRAALEPRSGWVVTGGSVSSSGSRDHGYNATQHVYSVPRATVEALLAALEGVPERLRETAYYHVIRCAKCNGIRGISARTPDGARCACTREKTPVTYTEEEIEWMNTPGN